MKNTTTRPFKVYLPGSKDKEPQYIATINVEVEDRFGEKFLTQESRRRIEDLRARHMGLMSGEAIKSMRMRLGLNQKELTDLLQCGEKSLSRWENGHGFPTGVVNTLLRLFDEGFLDPASLVAVQGPILNRPWPEKTLPELSQRKTPLHYQTSGKGSCPEIPKGWKILQTIQAA